MDRGKSLNLFNNDINININNLIKKFKYILLINSLRNNYNYNIIKDYIFKNYVFKYFIYY